MVCIFIQCINNIIYLRNYREAQLNWHLHIFNKDVFLLTYAAIGTNVCCVLNVRHSLGPKYGVPEIRKGVGVPYATPICMWEVLMASVGGWVRLNQRFGDSELFA